MLSYAGANPEHRMQALSDAWGQIALLVQMFLGLIAGPAQQTPPPPTISVNVFDYQHQSAAATSFNPHQHHHQQAATASNSSASSSTSTAANFGDDIRDSCMTYDDRRYRSPRLEPFTPTSPAYPSEPVDSLPSSPPPAYYNLDGDDDRDIPVGFSPIDSPPMQRPEPTPTPYPMYTI